MISLELAERALAHCSGEAQATVMRERSLLSRFARSKPTQAMATFDVELVNQHGQIVQRGRKALLVSKVPLGGVEASKATRS